MGLCCCSCLLSRIAGEWKNPNDMYKNIGLSKEAIKLVESSFDGLDLDKIFDTHCHLLGMNENDSGCYLHPNMDNCCRCISYAKKQVNNILI